MSFKDDLKDDLENTFLDIDEFGEELVVEGNTIIGVLDVGDTKNNILGTPSYGPNYGERFWEEKSTLYINKKDIFPLPKTGQNLEVNNQKYEIVESSEEDSLLAILLSKIGV